MIVVVFLLLLLLCCYYFFNLIKVKVQGGEYLYLQINRVNDFFGSCRTACNTSSVMVINFLNEFFIQNRFI